MVYIKVKEYNFALTMRHDSMKIAYPKLDYWSFSLTDLIQQFQTNSDQGLKSDEADRRISVYGRNLIKSRKRTDTLTLLFSQFRIPIIIIFMFTAVLSSSAVIINMLLSMSDSRLDCQILEF